MNDDSGAILIEQVLGSQVPVEELGPGGAVLGNDQVRQIACVRSVGLSEAMLIMC